VRAERSKEKGLVFVRSLRYNAPSPKSGVDLPFGGGKSIDLEEGVKGRRFVESGDRRRGPLSVNERGHLGDGARQTTGSGAGQQEGNAKIEMGLYWDLAHYIADLWGSTSKDGEC